MPSNPTPPRAAISDRLAGPPDEIVGEASENGRAARHDGWTIERKRTFIVALAQCGNVAEAARAAGMTRQSAYNLRNRRDGKVFALCWDGAILRVAQQLSDDLLARALYGYREVTVRDGRVTERHRYDNGLGLKMLARYDRLRESSHPSDEHARMVSAQFDEYVENTLVRGKMPRIVARPSEEEGTTDAGQDEADPLAALLARLGPRQS